MTGMLLVLAGAIYLTSRPRTAVPEKPTTYVWSVGMTSIGQISIRLPRQGKSETWVKHQNQLWYFAGPNGSQVDMKRWGGGIPLLVSGPEAKRVIAKGADNARLSEYGFDHPIMTLTVALQSGKSINVDVGGKTPDGKAYYIRLAQSRDVYTVDYTWYDVLSRLVLDPPYPGQASS